jgi:hypothetical protein
MCAIFCVRWSIGIVEYARMAANLNSHFFQFKPHRKKLIRIVTSFKFIF